jgi:flagellar operon protein
VISTIDRIGPGPTPVSQGQVDDPSLSGTSPLGSVTGSAPPTGQPSVDFRDALASAADERSLQFSEHALKRVDQRQIPLDEEQLDRLQKAMDTLSQRGSRQSLVMLDQVAYVVHVPSHTVVTAVQPDQSKERVFTQIDSVLIA